MNARHLIALGFAACLVMSPAAAYAQAISFSFGHGHHHGRHHGHYHHHCWDDPFWWGPRYDYVYVAPPPLVRREIRYVQPVEQVIETRVETPPQVFAPRSTSVASRPAAKVPLQIWNSAGQKVPVAFVVDGQEVTLSDGQSHTFYGSDAKLVEFDRGGDFGTTRRSLSGSQYEFVITDGGWDLVRRSDEPLSVTQRAAPRNELPGTTRR